jgi:zinc transporter, ZIP family
MNATDAVLALVWGLVSGGALIIGGLIGWLAGVSRLHVAWIMAFGAGILISAIAFDIMDDAFAIGGLAPSAGGFLLGALIFTVGSELLARAGARHRMRSTMIGPDDKREDSARAIALGTVIDGIPEAIVIGVSLIDGSGVALAAVIAIFLSNIPEALSSTVGMKANGRTPRYVFGLWCGITLISGFFSLAGYLVFSQFPPEIVAFTQAVAGGALIALIADTMIPEAFAETHELTGFIAAIGFLAGFAVSHGLA